MNPDDPRLATVFTSSFTVLTQNVDVLWNLAAPVQEPLNANIQMQQAVKNTNRMLPFITIGIEYRSKDVFLQLERVLVNLHVELWVQF